MDEASDLIILGMGFVFTFLTILVIVTKAMSRIVIKCQGSVNVEVQENNELDISEQELKLVIEKAIKLHRMGKS